MLQHAPPSDGLKRVLKTVTFTGAANLGAVGAVPIFTVTGQIWVVSLVPFCTTLLGEAAPTATLALGVTGDTDLFIAAVNAVDIDANEFWVGATPTAAGIALPAALKDVVVNANIIGTVAAQAVDSGAIRFVLNYRPLSNGSGVVPS